MKKKLTDIKSEIMWAVWESRVGFYCGTFTHRRYAIYDHEEKTGRPWAYHKKKFGSRVVKVIVSPVKP